MRWLTKILDFYVFHTEDVCFWYQGRTSSNRKTYVLGTEDIKEKYLKRQSNKDSTVKYGIMNYLRLRYFMNMLRTFFARSIVDILEADLP